jgi:hypothetical protein
MIAAAAYSWDGNSKAALVMTARDASSTKLH